MQTHLPSLPIRSVSSEEKNAPTPPPSSYRASAMAAVEQLQNGPFIPDNDSVLHLRGTQNKLLLGLVGLPARGKTYIGQKLSRFLTWTGYKARVFNIGVYRRELFGTRHFSEFFDDSNEEGKSKRNECAVAALKDIFDFFKSGGHAAIYDGTNSTVERREMVVEYIKREKGNMNVDLVWIESVCNDKRVIESNIRDTKLSSPDYFGVDPEVAVADFRDRIRMYEKFYQPLENQNESFVKLIDTGRQVLCNRIYGYLPSRIVFFLMNLRIQKLPLFISRHGQSEDNVLGRLGGDSSLTAAGKSYSLALADYLAEQPEIQELKRNGGKLQVWCSCLRRTFQTAAAIDNAEIIQWKALNEIEGGTCDGYTYEEINERWPEEFSARKRDKLRYRYPRGESYIDLIQRLEPVIFELERVQGPVVLIAHQAVLRCIYSYFLDYPWEEIPHLDIPLHTVVKLTPRAYFAEASKFQLCTEAGTLVSPPRRIDLPRSNTSLQYFRAPARHGHGHKDESATSPMAPVPEVPPSDDAPHTNADVIFTTPLPPSPVISQPPLTSSSSVPSASHPLGSPALTSSTQSPASPLSLNSASSVSLSRASSEPLASPPSASPSPQVNTVTVISS